MNLCDRTRRGRREIRRMGVLIIAIPVVKSEWWVAASFPEHSMPLVSQWRHWSGTRPPTPLPGHYHGALLCRRRTMLNAPHGAHVRLPQIERYSNLFDALLSSRVSDIVGYSAQSMELVDGALNGRERWGHNSLPTATGPRQMLRSCMSGLTGRAQRQGRVSVSSSGITGASAHEKRLQLTSLS